MWLVIVLSTLLFNVAFLFPDHVGFFVLFFPLPLWLWLRFFSFHHAASAGLLWGLLVFGVHFTWLLVLLWQHSQAAWWLCFVAYAAVVLYGALTAVAWFVVTAGLLRLLRLLVASGVAAAIAWVTTGIAYWLWIEYCFLRPLLIGGGYPFLNPLVPLAGYRWFCWMLSFVVSLTSGSLPLVFNHQAPAASFVYLAPVTNRMVHASAPWRTSPNQVGYKLYERLSEQHLHASVGPTIVVSPESTFSFPLNHHQDLIRLWASALPPQTHCLMGSFWQQGGRMYQALLWLHGGLIMKIYVKKYLAPFVERMPPAWRCFAPLKEAFLHNSAEFADTPEAGACDAFYITPRVCVVPRICSEFFLANSVSDFVRYRNAAATVYIVVAVNDSWFVAFFRRLLYNLTILKACTMQLPVVYVNHFGVKHI